MKNNSSKNLQNQAPWLIRLQYNFDNFMSKGGIAVFLALLSAFAAAFGVMTAIRYLSEWFFPNRNLNGHGDLLWGVFVQLIGLRDVGDDANFAAKLVGILTIFVGLVLFSSLVAFITQEFDSKIQALRKGKSLVLEENHTLILGFNDRILDIIRELILANESEEDAVIVILSEENKEDMDDFLRTNIDDFKTTRVVTRNGSFASLVDLNKVQVRAAKSVIILNYSKASHSEEAKSLADARVVKAILAVVAANEDGKLPPIVVELHTEQYRKLAENIAPGAVTTLNEADILARILVQTSRSAGMATVYLNLVGFEGNEFYFYRPEAGWKGLKFGELPFHFSQCIPLGVRHADGTLTIKASDDYKLAEGDKAIVLAPDDSAIQFNPERMAQPDKTRCYSDRCKVQERKIEKHLLIGWNTKTPIALREYATYLIKGSQVNLAVQHLTDEIKTEFDHISKAFRDINMEALEVKVDLVEQLKSLKPYEFNSISILASQGENAEQIDARTLTTLLEIRQNFKEYTAKTGKPVKTALIAEIVDSEDTDLAIKAGVKDFLLSNQFVSKILAQVSQEPDVMLIYRELFSVEGSELYVKPVGLYFPEDRLSKLTFADCVFAAQQRGEVCLGYKKASQAQNKNKNFGLYLVPPLQDKLTLTPNDALITIAEDET